MAIREKILHNDQSDPPKDVNLDETQIVKANEFLGSNPLAPYGQVEVVREMGRRI